jgi:hypothetical protein
MSRVSVVTQMIRMKVHPKRRTSLKVAITGKAGCALSARVRAAFQRDAQNAAPRVAVTAPALQHVQNGEMPFHDGDQFMHWMPVH